MPEIKIDDKTSVLTDKDNKKTATGLAKIAKAIVNDDFDQIGRSLVDDILIPSLKNTFAALGKNFIDMLFFGETKGNYYGSGASGYHNSYKSSGSSSNSSRNDKPVMMDQGDYFLFASPEINSRGDAEAILYKLNKMLDEWGKVEVFALFELVNETAPYTYNGYGWYNLNSAKASLGPDGYFIRLPKPIPLRK